MEVSLQHLKLQGTHIQSASGRSEVPWPPAPLSLPGLAMPGPPSPQDSAEVQFHGTGHLASRGTRGCTRVRELLTGTGGEGVQGL